MEKSVKLKLPRKMDGVKYWPDFLEYYLPCMFMPKWMIKIVKKTAAAAAAKTAR